MRQYAIFLCSFGFGACGSIAEILPPQEPAKPVPTILGDASLLKFAAQFKQDCLNNLSEVQCQLPHRITMQYFPQAKHPDKRGYAQLWGRKNTIHFAEVNIADYLQSSLWKEGLLVTVYHELFHAWFNLDHDDASLGIMNSTAYFEDDLIIAKDFQHYVSKEFARVKHK